MSDQTPATPVETETVTPAVETQPEVVTPASAPAPEQEPAPQHDDLGDDDFTAEKYWKSMSRKNEAAAKKAQEAIKTLQAENDALKAELGTIKFETTVASVLSEYGLPEGVRPLLTATDAEGLKVQAAALAALTGGKIPAPAPTPTPVTPTAPTVDDLNDGIPNVAASVPTRVINPLAGMSDNTAPKASSFGARFKARLDETR